MKLRPEDPMRTTATDSGPADGWRGARIVAELRERARRQAHRVQAAIDIGEPQAPRVTSAFLVLTAAVTLWEFTTYGASPTSVELARAGGSSLGAIATGHWWKLLTANLLHGNVPHILMNAFVIYLTGRWFEHLAGRWLTIATIAWAALLSSAGSILLDGSVTIGASGVAFGIIGCAVALDPRARTATGVIARQLALVNVILTFVVPGLSVGGHLGGLVAGLLVGATSWRRRRDADHPAGRVRRPIAAAWLATALPLVVVLAVGPRVLPDQARSLRSHIVAPLLARQLSGATLTGGLKVEHARCTTTTSPLRYRCTADGRDGPATFSMRDDQWSIALTNGLL
jgi:membrane associated rhomboid family serine protease